MKTLNGKVILIIFVIVFLLILGITGLTYSFFTAAVGGNEEANDTIVTTADLRLVFIDTDLITITDALPGVSATKTFTVQNIGTAPVKYNINILNTINEFQDGDLVYTITSDNNGGTKSETAIPATSSTLISGITINPGVTQTYSITVKFKETGENQNANQGAQFSGKLQIDASGEYTYEESTIASHVLSLSALEPESDVPFDYSNAAESGLYFTDSTTYGEDGKRIYYYRGNVNDNWVSFGGFYWRIVRTTSEGGIKLIYSGTATGGISGILNLNPGVSFNSSAASFYYIGYTYNTSLNGYTGVQTDSTIKSIVDTWYQANLLSYSNYLSETAIFCNDRSVESSDVITYFYGNYRMTTTLKPTFACASENASRYTVSSSTGNGYLNYPIALLSMDEAVFGGFVVTGGTMASSTYLLTDAEAPWWTMTPLSSGETVPTLYLAFPDGTFTGFYSNSGGGARPVVATKSCVEIAGGDGTKATPYTLTDENC